MTLKMISEVTSLWDKDKRLQYAGLVGKIRKEGYDLDTAMTKAYQQMTAVAK